MDDSPWEPLLSDARRLLGRGENAGAAEIYRQIVAREPREADALEGLGLVALRAGQGREAVGWFERARHARPGRAGILVNLGVAQKQTGALGAAIASYREAIAHEPTLALAWLNLARALREAGELAQAVPAFYKAAELDAEAPGAWSMLSNALREARRLPESLAAARRALALDPFYAEAHLNEGVALHLAGELELAAVSYAAALVHPESERGARGNLKVLLDAACAEGRAATPPLALARRLSEQAGDVGALLALARLERGRERPATAAPLLLRAAALSSSAATYRELAVLLFELGRRELAIERMFDAIALDGRHDVSYRLLGNWLCLSGKVEPMDERLASVIARCPDDVFALVNLGVVAQRRARPSEAVRLHRRALALDPKRLEAHLNLGAALSDQGLFAQAGAACRAALELDSERWGIWSNLMFSLHFDPALTPEAILAEHLRFGARAAASVPSAAPAFTCSFEPERRLRIGYVSPDLREHPVGYFMEPVLREHDARGFEVCCYSDAPHADALTARIEATAARFVECAGLGDQALAERIRADGVDILVDLAGHTGRNRLLTFARRPSPVQVSWLGYFGTTGLAAIDYRIADAHSVPPGAERFFSEEVVRLPRSANCFQHPPSPAPAPGPFAQNGHVTFGCFNNPSKVSRDVIAVFGRILRALPSSRLVLKYASFEDAELRARYLAWLGQEGVAAERVDLLGHSTMAGYLAAFALVDIALDPFPYSGETTALHSLWMGVPLVTLEGATLAQRLASRVLRVAGLSEWIAASRDEYVAIACARAADPALLARLRTALRPTLEASALFDHAGVTRELEAVYRTLWRRYCARH
jgi:predicted O-linked N-acetylglucosamine transferase (SPINDLY family)